MGRYIVVFEKVTDFREPNFNVYIEDARDPEYLSFLCYHITSLTSNLPDTRILRKDSVDQIFADFDVVILDSLREIVSRRISFENRAPAKQPITQE